MGADLPHTLYRKSGLKSRKVTQDDVDDATERMREAYERKRKERDEERKRQLGPTVEEIFGGALED